MKRKFLIIAGGVFAISASPLHAQIAERACTARLSVLQEFAPFSMAIEAAQRLNSQTSPDAVAEALLYFDARLGDALTAVPVSEEASYALVDVERIVDMLAHCRTRLPISNGTGHIAERALEEAYRRNLYYLRRPEFGPRLRRSSRASLIVRESGDVSAIDSAQKLKAAQDSLRAQSFYQAEKAELTRQRAADEARQAAQLAQAVAATRVAEEERRIFNTGVAGAGSPSPRDILETHALTSVRYYGGRLSGEAGLQIFESPFGGDLYQIARTISNVSCHRSTMQTYQCKYSLAESQLGAKGSRLGAFISRAVPDVQRTWKATFTRNMRAWESQDLSVSMAQASRDDPNPLPYRESSYPGDPERDERVRKCQSDIFSAPNLGTAAAMSVVPCM